MGKRVKAGYERVASLNAVVRRAGELSARTMIFDIEPLVAHWNSGQEELERGIAHVLGSVAAVCGLQVVCFSTNSRRRPPDLPDGAGVQVIYLASAGKPLRTAPYRRFPRPGLVIGDQVLTDGILALRLDYAFVLYDPGLALPPGPRLMAGCGRMVGPLFFRSVG